MKQHGLVTHGYSRSKDPAKRRTYNSWAMMLSRCRNPKNPKFYMYGGAGVSVCERWQSFENFLADMGDRPLGTSIDRMDGARGYAPGNCRWATPPEQMAHLKTSRIVRYGGRDYALPDLAKALKVEKTTLTYRIRAGWPEHQWGSSAWQGDRSRGQVQA